MLRLTLLGLLFLTSSVRAESAFLFGTAKKKITPTEPLWMAGYASRKEPCNTTQHDLWVKSLAIQDAKGEKFVLLTSDLCGIPRSVSIAVAAEVQKKTGLKREQILLTCSHTHCGPVVYGNLTDMYDLTPDQPAKLKAYTENLKTWMVEVIVDSLREMKPGKLSIGTGTAGFAKNRREFKDKGVVIGANPEGPVDRDVPVLKIEDEKGTVKAIVFGYACHNTTLGIMEWNGDYAGFAQIELEKKYPHAQAMFWIGFGADTNPAPRSKLELAIQHGKELADAVDAIVKKPLTELKGAVRCKYVEISIPLDTLPDPSKWKADALSKTTAVRNRANQMLKLLETGKIPQDYPHYPIQTVQFSGELTWILLGGEVVIDYNLRLKKELNLKTPIWFTGYANDVMAYIPSARVLKEGGYEADSSQIYYGMPTKWSEKIEDTIITKVKELVK
jgi:hypothetical protein